MGRAISKKRIKPITQMELDVGKPRRRAKDGSWRGGSRLGAGRKPKGTRAMVSHARRPVHKAAHPLQISMKVAADVPNLRQPRLVRLITQAMRQVHTSPRSGSGLAFFRIAEFSIQATHVHLVAEAHDKRALSRGMASLAIRIARGINRVAGRDGKVWLDRYYARGLTMPKEVRNALVYVLLNSHKHSPGRLAAGRAQAAAPVLVDARCTSAPWFTGFSPSCEVELAHVAKSLAVSRSIRGTADGPPVAAATTWLLTTGWRKHGLIHPRRDAPA